MIFLNLLLIAFRCDKVAMLFLTFNAGGIVLALSGALSVFTTMWAWRVGRMDKSFGGLFIGVAYLLPNLLTVTLGNMGLILWGILIAEFYVRWHLGRCCTITSPIWVHLVQSGPYRFVRHPLTMLQGLLCIVFTLGNPSLSNYMICGLVIVSKIFMCILEERFLKQESNYRAYCEQVKFRLIPRIW